MWEASPGIFQAEIDLYFKVLVSFSFKNILLLKYRVLKFFILLQLDIVIFKYQTVSNRWFLN